MKGFVGLTKRNLLIYFKDLFGVVFSLLTSLIVFGLYLLFLKGTFVDAIEGAMQGLETLVRGEDVEMLVNGILLTGILGSALVTVPYSCLQTIVRDRENKVDYDVSATPMKRGWIILSYFTAAAISAFLVTSVILTVGLVVLGTMGNMRMSAGYVVAAYGVVLLGAISATAFFMPVAICFKSSSGSNAFFGTISAVSGFVIGAYIPLSQFSEGIQTVCNLFPAGHITALLRNVLLTGLLDGINDSIGGVDQGAFVESVRQVFTFNPGFFGEPLSIGVTLVYVASAILVCVVAMVIMYGRMYRRK